MPSRARIASFGAVAGAAILLAGSAAVAEQAGGRSPETAKMKNPVAANPNSLAAGKKLYDAQCASCHGTSGKGDGKAGAMLKPPPPDLTDGEWKHGSSDGDVFVSIRDGLKQTSMRPYGEKIATNDIWNLVNYLRSLSPRPTKSR
jgi:mono/diheme cytochrome c family protein